MSSTTIRATEAVFFDGWGCVVLKGTTATRRSSRVRRQLARARYHWNMGARQPVSAIPNRASVSGSGTLSRHRRQGDFPLMVEEQDEKEGLGSLERRHQGWRRYHIHGDRRAQGSTLWIQFAF